MILPQREAIGSTPRFTRQDGQRIIAAHLSGAPATGVSGSKSPMRKRGVKLFEKYFWKIFSRKPRRGEAQGCVEQKSSVHRRWLLVLVAISAVHWDMALAKGPAVSELTRKPMGLMGEWCRVKKRMITQYTVKEGKLRIRSGRSGRLYEADLTCDEAYTMCETKTIRGWETPVTEILRLDGEKMNLTRVWGGAWKDKSYNFTFTRCPRW